MANYIVKAEQERYLYLSWLSEKVGICLADSPFSELINCLWEAPFVWQIPDDVNRAIDGNRLREVYMQTHDISHPEAVFPIDGSCTFLEFLIALASRANDIMYVPGTDQTGDYFWCFIYNLGMDHCTNDSRGYAWDDFYVHEKIGVVLTRSYNSDGLGGLFPLKNPREDQKNVSIWYQLNAFLNEF